MDPSAWQGGIQELDSPLPENCKVYELLYFSCLGFISMHSCFFESLLGLVSLNFWNLSFLNFRNLFY